MIIYMIYVWYRMTLNFDRLKSLYLFLILSSNDNLRTCIDGFDENVWKMPLFFMYNREIHKFARFSRDNIRERWHCQRFGLCLTQELCVSYISISIPNTIYLHYCIYCVKFITSISLNLSTVVILHFKQRLVRPVICFLFMIRSLKI